MNYHSHAGILLCWSLLLSCLATPISSPLIAAAPRSPDQELREYMAKIEDAAAREGPLRTNHDSAIGLAPVIFRSQMLAEEAKFGEAAELLGKLWSPQMAPDWKQMIETRLDILNRCAASNRFDLKDYRTFFLETGPWWFHERKPPIVTLWRMNGVPPLEKYLLIKDLLAKQGDMKGQVIVLDAIERLPGLETNAVADALLTAGNVLHTSGDASGAKEKWEKVMSLHTGSAAWASAVFNLALQSQHEKSYREAIGLYEKVLNSKPNDLAPGGHIMEAYRNYSHQSASRLSECYEGLLDYNKALDWARQAATNYSYRSWCGTCLKGAKTSVEQRITELERRRGELRQTQPVK